MLRGCVGHNGCHGGDKDPDPVVDIELLLIKYAWERAEKSLWDRLVRRKHFRMDVNWSYLDISHRVTAFQPRNRDMELWDIEALAVGQRELCLFRTEFVNSSTLPQNFTFKTERTTTNRYEVSLREEYRIGGNVNVRFTLPLVSISPFRGHAGSKKKLKQARRNFLRGGGRTRDRHAGVQSGEENIDTLTIFCEAVTFCSPIVMGDDHRCPSDSTLDAKRTFVHCY